MVSPYHKITLRAVIVFVVLVHSTAIPDSGIVSNAWDFVAGILVSGVTFVLLWLACWVFSDTEGWIRCDKRLPHAGQKVFFVHHGHVNSGEFDHADNDPSHPYFCAGGGRLWVKTEGVTHWQPAGYPSIDMIKHEL